MCTAKPRPGDREPPTHSEIARWIWQGDKKTREERRNKFMCNKPKDDDNNGTMQSRRPAVHPYQHKTPEKPGPKGRGPIGWFSALFRWAVA